MNGSSSESTTTMVASGIVTALAVVCVGLRFYVRKLSEVGIAWDDWWILIGLLTMLLTGGVLLWGEKIDPEGGAAIDNDSITFDYTRHTTYLKLSFICSILYFTVVTAIKISILLMYHRIFSVDASFRLQSRLVGTIVSAFWLATTIATLTNCRPLKYSWIGLSMEEYCFNYNIFWMVAGGLEVVIDTIILALPVRMVLGLQLSRKRKISVIFVFLLGGFVIITGIIRVIYGYVPGRRVPSYSKAELWSAIHIGMAIICACLPPLRGLLSRAFSFSATTSSSMLRRYNGLRAWCATSSSGSGRNKTLRTGNTVEALPLRRQDLCDTVMKDPHAETAWLTGRHKIIDADYA